MAAWFSCRAALPAEGAVIGPKLASDPGVSGGELLYAELNCAACHGGNGAPAGRLPARKSPRLGKDGWAVTPQYLRRFLLDPAGCKPGTTMPDLLHRFEGAGRADAAEALVHYLISEQTPDETPGISAEDYLLRQGRALYHSVGCVACHAPQIPAETTAGTAPADHPAEGLDLSLAGPDSVPLGDLARKTTAGQLARLLLDPLKSRPSGRMPSLGLTPGEARAIAVYLLREQAAGLKDSSKRALVAGLRYDYFEESFGGDPDFESFTPKASGTVATFDTAPRKREQSFGFRYSGTIRIPRDGRYTFFVESDDGGKLFIDGRLAVDNGGEHAPQEKRGAVELKAGEHALRATFYNSGGGYEFKVAWQPPGGVKEAIPPNLLAHYGQPMIPLDQADFAVDPVKADRGRALFAELGCAACHESEGAAKPRPVPIGNPAAGCLAENPEGNAPRFGLAPEQRERLRQAAANRGGVAEPVPAERVRETMAQLNCLACHTRDGQGAPASARLAYFRTAGEIDLGDEGRIPPHLTAVGGKLRPEWMAEVLTNRGRARPYMATRMPQFGPANVGHLTALFGQADASDGARPEPEATLRDAKFGRRLVGQGGLSCIACHTFGKFPSLGIPALDMTGMARRLKYDWFRRYLADPPALRPGTRMPNFWPLGRAANQDILHGDTGAQIDAIWAYLSGHPETDPPPGLIQGKQEIVAETEPVIYRNFVAGAGTRAIAVGYPEKVNLAFDANGMRLAMIWQGPFIDAARHRNGRGDGFEPPLGNNVVPLPEGPPFAVLPGIEASWPATGGKEAGYRMGGYELDARRRPSFFYKFGGMSVTETYEPVMGEIDAYFKRTLRLSGEIRDQLWFRAATGRIEEKNGGYLLGGKTLLRFPGARPVLRAAGAEQELLVPVRANGAGAVLVEEIIW